jgi:transposase InsO family protein
MVTRGLSERRALTVLRMSASALRYAPAPDRNGDLRTRIIALAQRHRRYGAGMIHLKLRQAGERANHKRVHRLYVAERLQIRRRRRKKVPLADRQPLVIPMTPNEIWSADFVFDRTAEGRVLKCLAIVDDATTEAVAIVPARALSGLTVTRVLDRLAATRGLPQVLRTDNGLPQMSRRQSFSDLTRVSASTHDANRQAVPPSRNHTLTIVTQGQAPGRPALTRLNRASDSRWKVRALSTRSHAPRRLLAKGSSRLVSSLPGSGDTRCRS